MSEVVFNVTTAEIVIDKTVLDLTVTTGIAGPQGAQGAAGISDVPGPQGAQGATGPQGSTGPQGADSTVAGPQGAIGPQGSTGAQGATGSQGSTGSQGAQGFQGSVGSQGATGSTGSQGPQGFQGATGPQGATGAQGAQGAQGSGSSDLRLNTRSGYYYGPATQGSTISGVTQTMAADRLFAVPYLVGAAFTADRIGVNVTTLSASGSIRLCIYNSTSDGTAPDTLLLDAGTVSAATTGDKEITISQALSANTLYWFVAVANAAPVVRSRNSSTFGVPFPTMTQIGGTAGTWYKDAAGSYTTPPTYGTPTGITSGQIGILVRAA